MSYLEVRSHVDNWRLKYQKSYGNMFRDFKAPTKLWLMFQEGKQHRVRYDRRFYSLQNTKQGKADVFNWCITPR